MCTVYGPFGFLHLTFQGTLLGIVSHSLSCPPLVSIGYLSDFLAGEHLSRSGCCARASQFVRVTFPVTMCLLYAVLALVFLLLLIHARCPYLVYDVVYVVKGLRVALTLRRFRSSTPCYTILDCFLDVVKKHPEKKFLVFEGRSYTYSEADKLSSKAARALLHHTELQEGDTAAVFLGNEPNFIWVWLGLFKLGCTAALLNSNIRSRSLLHCFTCCGTKTLIAGAGKTIPNAKGICTPLLSTKVSIPLRVNEKISLWKIS